MKKPKAPRSPPRAHQSRDSLLEDRPKRISRLPVGGVGERLDSPRAAAAPSTLVRALHLEALKSEGERGEPLFIRYGKRERGPIPVSVRTSLVQARQSGSLERRSPERVFKEKSPLKRSSERSPLKTKISRLFPEVSAARPTVKTRPIE